MLTLDPLTHDHFEPLIGQAYLIGETVLTLHDAKLLGHRRTEALRDPFSLLVCGPQGLRLPQGIYHMKNESLGELEMFITQVGDGAKGSEFEAIFS